MITDPPPAVGRRLIARATSLPLASLAAYFLKASQNFYAETMLKTLGRSVKGAGAADAGRDRCARNARVMGHSSRRVRDLRRIGAVALQLRHRRHDGRDAEACLAGSAPARTVRRRAASGRPRRHPRYAHEGHGPRRTRQAKTGTISNVRSLSGFLETKSGERLVFSIIANNFTAPSTQIDAVVERALARLAER